MLSKIFWYAIVSLVWVTQVLKWYSAPIWVFILYKLSYWTLALQAILADFRNINISWMWSWMDFFSKKENPKVAFFEFQDKVRVLDYASLIEWLHMKVSTVTFSLVEVVGWLVIAFTCVFLMYKVARSIWRSISFFYSRNQWLCDFAEKMMPGSVLEFVPELPQFQVEIWLRQTGAFYKAGQAFNTQFGIFTAMHVVEDAQEIRLVRGDKTIDLEPRRFLHLESDVALLKLTAQETGKLGLSQAKLLSIATPPTRSGLLVRIQAFGNRTMGILRPNEGFGMCTYEGSTIKGFSGAPYHVAKQVYGMHIGGSTSNIGFEAAYLYMLAKTFQEDTEDYLEKQIMDEGADYTWQRSPYNPDEARVKTGDKYFMVDLDTVREWDKRHSSSHRVEYFKPDYEQEAREETLIDLDDVPLAPRGALSYDDTGSKNLIRTPAVAGVSGMKEGKVVQDQRQPMPKGMDYESRKPLDSSVSDGPMSTHAPQSEVLGNTRRYIRSRKRELSRLQKRMKQLREQLMLTEPGK